MFQSIISQKYWMFNVFPKFGSFCFLDSIAAQGSKGSPLKIIQVHTEGRDGPKSDDFGRTFFKDAPYLCVTYFFCCDFLNTISG